MSSKNKILLRKICAVSLAAAMLAGTGAVAEISTFIGINISVSAAGTTQETPVSSFYYYENDDGGITITNFKGNETEVVIPSKIDGKPVTRIGESIFDGYTSLTSITIPDSVTAIGYGTFFGCASLTSITIPDSVTAIDSRALGYYCGEDSRNYEKIPGFTIYGKNRYRSRKICK